MNTLLQRDTLNVRELVQAVTASDGYRLHYKVWSASHPSATVVLLHGLMSHSGWLSGVSSQLCSEGVKVVGADRRGSGMNQAERGDAPSRQLLLEDLHRVLEQEHCGAPIYIVGWCWGAVLAINAALEFGREIKGLALLAPGVFPSALILDRARSECLDLPDEEDGAAVLPSPITEGMFSESPEVQKFILNDDLAVRRFTPRLFRVAREMSLIAATRLPQTNQPVLLVLAAHDQAVDNQRTLGMVDRLRRSDVTVVTLACSHGMQFEVPDQLNKCIVKWLRAQPTSVQCGGAR